MSLKLHPVVHNNGTKHWCGPTVVSAVTGLDTRTVTQCIRAVSGEDRVMGTSEKQLRMALYALGVHAVLYYSRGHPTLAAWARRNRELFARQPVIVGLTHHWVAVCGRRFLDSHTNGQPVPLSQAPHRRARVGYYLVLSERPGGASWKAPAPPKRDWAAARARAGVLKLAELHGITVEPHFPGEWWVYPPKGFGSRDVDPYWDEHLAYDADDRAERIRAYANLVLAKLAEVTL